MPPQTSRRNYSWSEIVEVRRHHPSSRMGLYEKAKNKVTTGRSRGPTSVAPTPPPPPPAPEVDIEDYKKQTELANEYAKSLVSIRHDTLEALGPGLRMRLYTLKPDKSWWTKELVRILGQEFVRAKEQLKNRDSQEYTVSRLLNIGGGQSPEEEDPFLQALAEKEAALKRSFDEAWKSHAKELEHRHKLAIQAKNRELTRLEDELNTTWGASLEKIKTQHGLDLAQHEQDIKTELDTLDMRWRNYVDDLQETHHALIRSKDGELHNIERRVDQKWQETVEGLELQIGQLRSENETAIQKHEQELHAKDDHYKYEYDLLADAKISVEAAHEKELQESERRHGDRIRQLQRSHDEKLQSMKDDHGEEQRQLESRFNTERDRLKTTIEDLRKKHENDIQDLKLAHAREIGKIDDEHELEVKKLKAQKDQIERQIREQWQEDVKGLKQNITSLNAILFARDRFTAVPDRILGEKFSSLVHDVQNLARQPWRPEQRVWTDAALKSITSNTSRLREQLLQDRIWWTLHDYIFCSPFRMFGEEGRTLESGWNTACGRGKNKACSMPSSDRADDADFELRTGEYTWPKPALDTERWRWEAVKSCQTALKEPASHLDPRAKIKRGFKESRDNLIAALRKNMEEVARFDQSVMTDVEKLVKKAVNLWLEFEIQRCRLMMIMPAERVQLEEDKMNLARQQKLALTSLPGLIRYGDDSGQELNVRQTVGSCNPDVVRVS